ncbi:MAG: hypothetical protein PVJ27_04865, partial [Candidatus Brocadiaceae bacterium]
KRQEYDDPLREMTDLCGGRVIAPSKSELADVCEFIESHFAIDWENSVDVAQRHRPAEFGYRSIHYIVQWRAGVFPDAEVDVEVPERLMPSASQALKAEIQVRTMLEHIWAVFSHDRTYKSAFPIPRKWQRELAAVAATLEDADNAFERIRSGLEEYAASYGAYMSDEEIRREMAMLETVLEYDPENADLADRIGKLAITVGDWQKCIGVLTPYVDSGCPAVLRDLGIALCKSHRDEPDGAEYRQGQEYLEAAVQQTDGDADAIASLAGTWKGIDDEKARALYGRAFRLDPYNPYPLGNYLEYQIVHQDDVSAVTLMEPTIRRGLQRCRDQAEVGMNIPWAFYDMGKFQLLLGNSQASLAAHAKAVELSTAPFMIATSLDSMEMLTVVADQLPGYEWVERLLVLGCAAKFGSEPALQRVRRMATPDVPPTDGPVVILTGSCDRSVEEQVRQLSRLIVDAFSGFRGTVVSGGTTAGVSGLAGELQATYPDAIHTVGYVPGVMPEGVQEDARYSEIRRTGGTDFSPLEALQGWTDLIASGIRPARVKILGIGGGSIAAAEYRMGLALGARVAVVGGSGREAGKILVDEDWKSSTKLLRLDPDAEAVRRFITPGGEQ